MKKIVFFDIDGTLVSKHHSISTSTRQAIQSLKKEGILPVIATGRSLLLLKEIADSLHINSFISMNGQYIVINGQVIYHNPIPKEEIYSLVNYVSHNKDGLILCGDNEVFTNSKVNMRGGSSRVKLLKKLTRVVPKRIQMSVVRRAMQKPPRTATFANEKIFQGILAAPSSKKEEYSKKFPDLAFTRANKYMFDVVNKGTSKGTGVEKVLDYFGVSWSDSYAFGDHLNDLEMLEYAGVGIAMGNAVPEAKQAADFVTDPVKREGIEKALKKLELIR